MILLSVPSLGQCSFISIELLICVASWSPYILINFERNIPYCLVLWLHCPTHWALKLPLHEASKLIACKHPPTNWAQITTHACMVCLLNFRIPPFLILSFELWCLHGKSCYTQNFNYWSHWNSPKLITDVAPSCQQASKVLPPFLHLRTVVIWFEFSEGERARSWFYLRHICSKMHREVAEIHQQPWIITIAHFPSIPIPTYSRPVHNKQHML